MKNLLKQWTQKRHWTEADIATYLGTSRYKVGQIRKEVLSFPLPSGQRGRTLVWSRREIKRWNRAYRPKTKLKLGHAQHLGL